MKNSHKKIFTDWQKRLFSVIEDNITDLNPLLREAKKQVAFYKDLIESLRAAQEALNEYIEKINKAFFGSANNNAYVSVAEYFNRSSYGKLKLGGKVCDEIFTFPLPLSEIRERKLKRDALATEYYGEVIKWYESKYDDIDNF